MILPSGDFPQILPVIPKSTVADETLASNHQICGCYVKKHQMSANIEVSLLTDPSTQNSSNQLLIVGNGLVSVDESSI